MGKNATLLLLVFILVVSAADATESPTNTVTHESPNFVLSQTEMPIYEIITPDVDLAYAENLAFDLFGIRDPLAAEVEGIFVVNSGNKSFEVDSSDGSIWYADYARLWNISYPIDRTTPAQCQSSADVWLTEHELLPGNAYFKNIGNTTAQVYEVDTGEEQSQILQFHVNYEFTVGEYPVTGETAQISVMIGEGGPIVALDWKCIAVEPEVYTTASLLTYESILDVHEIAAENVVSHELVYHLEPGDALLVPVYEIVWVDVDASGNDIHHSFNFDATNFDPVVNIVTPVGTTVATIGDTITFDCDVILGTPPYTYLWKSDFDGTLSTANTFSISTLTEVLKKEVNVPHSITVSIRDAENRFSRDIVAVFIQKPTLSIDITVVMVALGAVVLLSVSLVIMKKRGIFILPFLLMLLSAFVFLPIASAGSGMPTSHGLTPSDPTGAYDDGIKEVGVEWIGLSHHKRPLVNCEPNTEGFYAWMGGPGGYSQEFSWHEYSAWEEDFKDASFGGTDTDWADAVDMAYIHTHGGPRGLSFTSNHDTKFLNFTEMRWGDGDLDTIALDACKPLAWSSYGKNVYERWGPAMQGIHQVCSFQSNSKNSAQTGPKFGLYMTGFYTLPATTIINAWFRACIETEPSSAVAAVFYATKSTNPYQPQQDDPINDYAYGFGYSCSDPTPGTYKNFVYITVSC